MPFVFARASVWQEPHLATNCCLPTIRLALSLPLTAPQPPAPSNRPPVPARSPSLRRLLGGESGDTGGETLSDGQAPLPVDVSAPRFARVRAVSTTQRYRLRNPASGR